MYNLDKKVALILVYQRHSVKIGRFIINILSEMITLGQMMFPDWEVERLCFVPGEISDIYSSCESIY